MEKQQKKIIFEEAKKASDNLVFWNHPNIKKRLSELDKAELEYKLWKDNKLDAFIYRKLGSDGWNNYKPFKLSDQDCNFLVQETKQLQLFLNSLKKG